MQRLTRISYFHYSSTPNYEEDLIYFNPFRFDIFEPSCPDFQADGWV